MKWFHAARARLRLLAPRTAESRIDDEIRFHIEMETERIIREQQLEPDEARRRALVTFGGVDKHKEALRDERGTAWFTGMSLDLKLGARMLVKYPGLTIVGGLATEANRSTLTPPAGLARRTARLLRDEGPRELGRRVLRRLRKRT